MTTIQEAIRQIQQVGSIRAENGDLKVRIPAQERARLQPAIEVLRREKEAALQVLGEPKKLYTSEGCIDAANDPSYKDPYAGKKVYETWADWKAASLNKLFLEQGKTGRPGRITAETIRHGAKQWVM
jgi:hypothetical protein